MREIIARMDPSELRGLLRRTDLEQLTALHPGGPEATLLDPSSLAEYVLALFDTELLEDQKRRYFVFSTLDSATLELLCDKHLGRHSQKPRDNALSLSIAPWGPNKALVSDVATLLSIPSEYLPSQEAQDPAVEVIEPWNELPSLLDHQAEVKAEVVGLLAEGRPRFLVQMPTGAGKTRTVIEALVVHCVASGLLSSGGSVIWLCHTEELCEQAISTLKRVWRSLGSSPVSLVRYWGTRSLDSATVEGSFVFTTLQKSHSALRKSEHGFELLCRCARVAVVDEAHKAIAPTYKAALERLLQSGAVLLGLTATPGRSRTASDENKELADFFGGLLVAPELGAKPIDELRRRGVLSNLRRSCVETAVEVSLSNREQVEADQYGDIPVSVLDRLAGVASRNLQILSIVEDNIEQGRPSLVFSCSVAHSRLLSTALRFRGFAAGYVDGSMKPRRRKSVVEGFRNGELDVLMNFGVLSTGFDAPKIRAVVITRPTGSLVLYSQMIGRALRGPKMGGGAECYLVDMRDNLSTYGHVDDVYRHFEGYWNQA